MSRRRDYAANMFVPEDDIHKKFAGEQFFSEFKAKEPKKYEYTTPEKGIDRTKKTAEYTAHLEMMKVYNDTQKRNNVLRNLMRRRQLTEVEKNRMKVLQQKDKDDTILDDEIRELKLLGDIQIKHEEDIRMQQTFLGINKVHYYMGARNMLKRGSSAAEWDGEVTHSREGEGGDRHAVIAVGIGELLDEYMRQKGKGMNPLLIVCGDRLNPGGQWEKGVRGVEEDLFYIGSAGVAFGTDICIGFYPLQDDAVIYAPKILQYRQSATQLDIEKKQELAFFSTLIYAPQYLAEGTSELDEEQQDILKAKFRNAIQTALYWGHDSIIFTPFGDGHPGNYPAEYVTSIFKHIFFGKKQAYNTKLKRVTFIFSSAGRTQQIYQRELHNVDSAV
jgi:hypothetical protein